MNSFTSVRDAAVTYLTRRWQPVPIPPKSKNPGFDEWQKFTCTPDEVAHHFNGAGNIGMLLGEPSGGLVDIDLDCPEAVFLAPRLLPPYTPRQRSREEPSLTLLVYG